MRATRTRTTTPARTPAATWPLDEQLSRDLSEIATAGKVAAQVGLILHDSLHQSAMLIHVDPQGKLFFGWLETTEAKSLIGSLESPEETDFTDSFWELGEAVDAGAQVSLRLSEFAGILSIAAALDTGYRDATMLIRPLDSEYELVVIKARKHGNHERLTSFSDLPNRFDAQLRLINKQANQPQEGGLALEKAPLEIGEDGADPRTISLSSELQACLDAQAAMFREKFGRAPGPEDPIFFDPEADEPRPFSAAQVAEIESLFDSLGLDDIWTEETMMAAEAKGSVIRPGRNDPCLCASGKKYKNCCLGRPIPGQAWRPGGLAKTTACTRPAPNP